MRGICCTGDTGDWLLTGDTSEKKIEKKVRKRKKVSKK